jgi:hypothetical protein
MWENSYLYDNVGIFHFENGFYGSQTEAQKCYYISNEINMNTTELGKLFISSCHMKMLIFNSLCHKNADQSLANCMQIFANCQSSN